VLYFTGSAHFNRSLRAFCKRAGLTLSDAGLSLAWRRKGYGKVRVGESVRCAEERDVFEALGIEYVAPEYRECGEEVATAAWEETLGHFDEDSGSEEEEHF